MTQINAKDLYILIQSNFTIIIYIKVTISYRFSVVCHLTNTVDSHVNPTDRRSGTDAIYY